MTKLYETAPIKEKAILVGANINNNPRFFYSMLELENLAEACDIEVLASETQNLHQPTVKYYIGPGKLEDIIDLIEDTEANVVIFNTELSPIQMRNIENMLDCKILDRTMLILQIFEQRAQTKEAKLQVEIARLQYFLPRLVGLRSSLDRQGGGGASGTYNRGAGEKQIDLDRRQIEEQITFLKKELQAVVKRRQVGRSWRRKQEIKTVALVGYTNAGKSTLMNQFINYFAAKNPDLTTEDAAQKHVFVKDMLFATLQTASRRIDMPHKKSFILTDTVGFVSELPHHLVEAFKSTLEEINEADLLLHVIDASSTEAETMEALTLDIIRELGAGDLPILRVFNKIDTLDNIVPENTETEFYISAKTGTGLPDLINGITKKIFADHRLYELKIPYSRGDITAFYHQNVHVINEHHDAEGTILQIMATEPIAYTYKHDIISVRPI